MEDFIWQLEFLQFVGAVVALVLSLCFSAVAIINSWQIGEDVYRLAKDGIEAKRAATETEPFAVNWKVMRRTLLNLALMALRAIVFYAVGYFFVSLFAAYVVAASGG